MMSMIYFDNAATTPLCGAAFDAMIPLLREGYGNPSSQHEMGQRAAAALFSARRDMAECLGCAPNEIFFTSGGSEADSMALFSAAELGGKLGRRHIISQKTEHHAVLNALSALSRRGFDVTLLDTDSEGRLSPEALERAIRPDTAFVSVMTANNEIGTIHPIKELADVCRNHKVLFHTDAVQAVGHIPTDMRKLGCDMLSLSAHKFGGPKGAGALYVRGGIEVFPLIHGTQEMGKRGGTENLPAIAGMAAALKEAFSHIEERSAHTARLRDRLIGELSDIPCAILNGSPTERLCGNVSFCFEGHSGERMVYKLNKLGICASAGAACSSGMGASHVLLGIGRTAEQAQSAVRLSLSHLNTEEEVKTVSDAIRELLKAE